MTWKRIARVAAARKFQRITIDDQETGGTSWGQLKKQDGRKRYTIVFDEETRIYGCTCPAWVYQKGAPEHRGACKHIRAYLARMRGRETNLLVVREYGKVARGRVVPVRPLLKDSPVERFLNIKGKIDKEVVEERVGDYAEVGEVANGD